MKEMPISKNFTKVVNILIFIFPIVIISLQVAGDIVLFILVIMGIFIAISRKLSPFAIQEIKVFSYLCIGYFIAVCLSVLFSGQMKELAHYIPRDFYFLFAPFIALALYRAEININYLLVGIKVALLILGMIVSYNLFIKGLTSRPTGVMNAGVFGNLSVSLFFLVLIFFQQESFKHKIFSLLSLFSGFFIILVSGTRGAWLSFLLLLGVYLYFFYKQKSKLRKKLLITALIVISGVISVTSLNQKLYDETVHRVQLAYLEISDWAEGGTTPTSVGLRLNMYKKAIVNISDVPFFGYGLRTSNTSLFKDDLSSMGIISFRYNHLHNGYLTNYYNGGIVLLVALLLVLFLPLVIFLKANKQDRKNPVFISGAFLTLGYASYGMVNILLGDTYMNGFYVFFLAIFLLLTNKSIKY